MISCGIDPGRDKFGLALGDGSNLLFSAVIPVTDAEAALSRVARGNFGGLAEWRREGDVPPENTLIGAVYLGDGTGFHFFSEKLDRAGLDYIVVDERLTTFDARGLYWKLHPPAGLWRLVPLTLRVPPRPVDDLAAWAIIMRAGQ
jgi:RNase H-fold protein (predicted Holliday junction resolvase)